LFGFYGGALHDEGQCAVQVSHQLGKVLCFGLAPPTALHDYLFLHRPFVSQADVAQAKTQGHRAWRPSLGRSSFRQKTTFKAAVFRSDRRVGVRSSRLRRWSYIQPLTSEHGSASAGVFGHGHVHDNVLDGWVQHHLHAVPGAGRPVRAVAGLLVLHGFNRRPLHPQPTYEEIQQTVTYSFPSSFYSRPFSFIGTYIWSFRSL